MVQSGTRALLHCGVGSTIVGHETSESDAFVTSDPKSPPTGRNPESPDFPSGPDIGKRLPEINLQDQHGNWVNLEQSRGDRRALVVFHRSVRW
jgi:hypothetical protein